MNMTLHGFQLTVCTYIILWDLLTFCTEDQANSILANFLHWTTANAYLLVRNCVLKFKIKKKNNFIDAAKSPIIKYIFLELNIKVSGHSKKWAIEILFHQHSPKFKLKNTVKNIVLIRELTRLNGLVKIKVEPLR